VTKLIHGGAKALWDFQRDREFTGLAYDKQQEIQATYESAGPAALIVKNAVRLQTINELYYDAVMKAANDKDVEYMTSLLKVWGWVVNSSIRALELAHKLDKPDHTAAITAMLKTYREPGEEG